LGGQELLLPVSAGADAYFFLGHSAWLTPCSWQVKMLDVVLDERKPRWGARSLQGDSAPVRKPVICYPPQRRILVLAVENNPRKIGLVFGSGPIQSSQRNQPTTADKYESTVRY
jgi:hypothetical protein